MQVDAVEVVARLLGRDGKARLVDQPLQVLGRELELLAHLARADVGEVFGGQRLQGKARLASGQRQALLLAVLADVDLRAVGQLAHDIVQHVRRNGDGARRADVARHALDDLAFQIRRLELELGIARPQKHVGEDRDRRTPLDDARDVAERPQEFTTFNHKPHGCFLGAFLRAKPASLLAE